MDQLEAEITIVPDPQILQVLTYLEMRPLDSLCELIDNSLDAFATQNPLPGAMVAIDLPSRKEVEDGNGVIRVRDNGPGMTLNEVQNSLRAGYSSKSRYGRLGLFGVGFNIATGKLGRVTKLLTARDQDEFATEVKLDLETLRRSGNFVVKALQIAKPAGFQHGTLVDVSTPWGPNNQNHGFMLKLVSLGRPKILSHLGRIYSTILRENKVKILVGTDAATPYHHCIWDDSRYVEHAKHGRIPAVFRFNNSVIYTYRRCVACSSVIPAGESRCIDPACASSSTVTQEERISGWVGIQRYTDPSHYGIDLVRNGRAIRLLEKAAFFEFQDPETGDPIFDYPVDNREGRIVGEIHFNHVPVDPAKQNFERSSPEWKRAVSFLRGDSSLQPERPGAGSNQSPIFKLYQGYRKIRGPGKRSMYMGKWLPGSLDEPKILTKPEIELLKSKFEAREPGYFDDAEWWKLVEQADQKPVAGLVKCPSCSLESPQGLEDCPHCGHVFDGKQCVSATCSATIVKSAITCPHCGSNQIPEIKSPWRCEVCSLGNSSDQDICVGCSSPRGLKNPLSKDSLTAQALPNDALSITALSVPLANATTSSPINVVVSLVSRPLLAHHSDGTKVQLPSVKFIGDDIDLFIDPTHPLFERGGVTLENHVAFEVAAYLFSYYQSLSAKAPAEHSVPKIAYDILKKRWPSKFSPAEVEDELLSLFDSLKQRLADSVGSEAADAYANLSQEERTALASEVVRSGRDISELGTLRDTGRFLHFVRPRAILEIFRINPKLFFDGRVWSNTYAGIDQIHPEGWQEIQAQIKGEHASLLEIAVVYANKGVDNPREANLAKAACQLLTARLTT